MTTEIVLIKEYTPDNPEDLTLYLCIVSETTQISVNQIMEQLPAIGSVRKFEGLHCYCTEKNVFQKSDPTIWFAEVKYKPIERIPDETKPQSPTN